METSWNRDTKSFKIDVHKLESQKHARIQSWRIYIQSEKNFPVFSLVTLVCLCVKLSA